MNYRSILRFIVLLGVATALLAACGPAPPPDTPSPEASVANPTAASPLPSANTPAEHRIGIRTVGGVAEFYDKQSGETFVPRGANYFILEQHGGRYENVPMVAGIYDRERTTADFATLRKAGFNTVRIFLDSCGPLAGCMGKAGGTGLNPDYLDNVVDVMQVARQQEMFILFTSNDLPENGGYGEILNRGANDTFAGYRNANYLTGPGIEATRLYWTDLMAGLVERDAAFDVVLGWSLLNEQWMFEEQPPLSLTSGTATTANGQSYELSDPAQKRLMASDGVRFYIEQVSAVIRQYDPTALVTMGFFAPDFPNTTSIGGTWHVDTAPLLAESSLDFFDFHAYPGSDITLAQIAENFGMPGYDSKPIIMGEVGAFQHLYPSAETAAATVQAYIAESCGLGFDGWLYWGFYTAPQAVGDATWGLVDADGIMLEAISPANQPDPCVTTTLPSSNVALDGTYTASASLGTNPPALAFDGLGSAWVSGADAPGWIQVAFNQPVTITRLRLVVDQSPPGETVHEIWAGRPGEALFLLHTFSQNTDFGDELIYELPEPEAGISTLQVRTTQSPSWVAWQEIEIIGSLTEQP